VKNNYSFESRVGTKNIIIVDPLVVQNQKLSKSVTVSNEFRIDFDNWLLDFFGYKILNLISDGAVLSSKNGYMMNRNTFENLKEHLDAY
jgi:hypothetical protein